MSSRLFLAACLSAAVLSACATRQENPFYEYSTKYPEKAAPTQMASTQPTIIEATPVTYIATPAVHNASAVTQTQTSDRVIKIIPDSEARPLLSNVSTTPKVIDPSLTQVDGKCVQAGAIVPCTPVAIPIPQAYARVSAPYAETQDVIMAASKPVPSTDAHYGGALTGTPGYYATHQTPTDYVTVETNHLYADQTPSAETVIAPSLVEAGTSGFANRYVSSDGTMLHRVVAGDTVYSLAQKTCSSVANIQAINGLDASFAIRQGDTLRLPGSGC